MKYPSTSTRHHNTIPFAVPPADAPGQSADAKPAAAPAPDADETPAPGGAPRGRPTGYAPKILDMMKGLVRRFGLSDSAAAEGVGMSTSTISRWKKQFPEVAEGLQQARQECRIHHLELIMKHAEAEDGRGWRASAWLLERLFPGDYSPRMSERFAHRNFEEQRLEREDAAAVAELRRELHAAQKAQAKASAAPAEPENRAAASESDSHNSRNADGNETADEPQASMETGRSRPDGIDPEPSRPDSLAAGAHAQASCFDSEADSRNSRNAHEAEEGSLARALFAASEADSHNSRNATPSAMRFGHVAEGDSFV